MTKYMIKILEKGIEKMIEFDPSDAQNIEELRDQSMDFDKGTDAVHWLATFGLGESPKSKRFNPLMKLNSLVKSGYIVYLKDGEPVSMSNGKGDSDETSWPNEAVPTSESEPAATPTPKKKQTTKSKKMSNKKTSQPNDKLQAIEALQALFSNDGVNREELTEIVAAEIAKQKPSRISIKVAKTPAVQLDFQHKEFKNVLSLLANGMNVWLTGPAGSGKTTAAVNCAKALKVEFYAQSVCAQTTKHEFFGYNDANGKYVETSFYKAFKNGGVFLVDEIDAGNPNVLAVLNSALDNDVVAFPNGMVKKHKNFKVVAAANTRGTGGNMEYVGRNRIDGATLDRFWMVNWDYDHDFEAEIAPNKDFAKKVQALRDKANKLGLLTIISPRLTIQGGKMIEAGFSESKVLDMMLYNKMPAAEAKTLKA